MTIYTNPFAALFPRYLFLDIEASSLAPHSFPIEIGWCDAALAAESFLICPLHSWTDWSPLSAMIHNIDRAQLLTEGISAEKAAVRLNQICNGRIVLSDNPSADAMWLGQLFHDTGIVQAFSLHDANQLASMAAVTSRLKAGEAQALLERINHVYPHPHRAGPDARRCAAQFLAMALPAEIDTVISMA